MPRRLTRRHVLTTGAAALAGAGFGRPAAAGGVTSTMGAVRLLRSPPASVALGALESDDTIFVFAERQGHVLRRNLDVDISRPGDYRNERSPRDPIDWSILGPRVIRAGTRVDSFYFHYDNASYATTLRGYFRCEDQIGAAGRIVFDRPILGIIGRAYRGRQDFLGRSNRELGLPDVVYSTRNFREFPGLNIADGCGTDRIALSADRRVLDVRNVTDVHHDNYRVVVAA